MLRWYWFFTLTESGGRRSVPLPEMGEEVNVRTATGSERNSQNKMWAEEERREPRRGEGYCHHGHFCPFSSLLLKYLVLKVKPVNAHSLGDNPSDVSFSICIDQSGSSQSPRLFASQHKPTNPPTCAEWINRGGNPVYTCVLRSPYVPHTHTVSLSLQIFPLNHFFCCFFQTQAHRLVDKHDHAWLPLDSETKQAHVINTLPLPFHCVSHRQQPLPLQHLLLHTHTHTPSPPGRSAFLEKNNNMVSPRKKW